MKPAAGGQSLHRAGANRSRKGAAQLKHRYWAVKASTDDTNRSRKGAAQLKPVHRGADRLNARPNRSRKGAAQLKPRIDI